MKNHQRKSEVHMIIFTSNFTLIHVLQNVLKFVHLPDIMNVDHQSTKTHYPFFRLLNYKISDTLKS